MFENLIGRRASLRLTVNLGSKLPYEEDQHRHARNES